MKTMVCFRKADSAYLIPVESTRAVRAASGLMPLPEPREGVVGIVPGDPPLTVISPFGSGGKYLLVVQTETKRYGLLVDEVVGLRRIDEGAIRGAPDGQVRALVCGSVTAGGETLLVADPDEMAGRL